MTLLVIGELAMIPIAIVFLVVLLAKNIMCGTKSWRDAASRVTLGIALASGLIICAYFVRVAVWHDETANAGAILGIHMFAKWGHWGVWCALAGVGSSLIAKGQARIASSVSSILFASFWLVGYMFMEMQ